MNKKELDNWISLNFDDLLDVATNIISYRNYEPGVLINMTYEYLLEKINILTKKNIRSIAINWMNTNIKRQNTRIKSGRESECLRKNHLFDFGNFLKWGNTQSQVYNLYHHLIKI